MPQAHFLGGLLVPLEFVYNVPQLHQLFMTQCKNEGRIQSTPVPKNLTLHRMSKIEFQPDFRNPQMHSFPNMPIMGWVALVEVGQKKDFLQKSAEKQLF